MLPGTPDGRQILSSDRAGLHLVDLATHTSRPLPLPPTICGGAFWCGDIDWR
jgi:hypothetical protein